MSVQSSVALRLDEQLSPRDLAVIAGVASLRYLTARQLERWHYRGPTPLARARAARRGLERLTELRYLARLERRIGGVRAGSAGSVYTLAPVASSWPSNLAGGASTAPAAVRQPGRGLPGP